MFMVQFDVEGIPVPKGRPRHTVRGGFVHSYTPEQTRTYEAAVRERAKKAMGSSEPLETPIKAFFYVRLPIPKTITKKRLEAIRSGSEMPIRKPDLTNIVKSLEDALNGVVYKDDCQIVTIHTSKVYSTHPGVDILIQEYLP